MISAKDQHVQSFGGAGFTVKAGEGPLTLSQEEVNAASSARVMGKGPASKALPPPSWPWESPRQEAMRRILDISW